MLDRVVDPVIDRFLGMETAEGLSVEELGLDPDQAFAYRVAGWRSLQVILRPEEVSPNDVFVDFGCGKGRVLYLASRYRFARIIGVELSQDMAARARRNLRRQPRVTVEVANAADWKVPDDVTVAFFHHPFPNAVFERVTRNLLRSDGEQPRPLRIVYRRPHRMHGFLLSRGFELVRQSPSGPTNLYRWKAAQ